MRLVISFVVAQGIADDLGLTPGDRLISINGFPVKDVIDYLYLMADEVVLLDIERQNDHFEIEIEKDFDDTLGVEFNDPVGSVRRCANQCLFCFVDQMPPGMRDSLYIKDDDYRLSFLRGNFITLTNLQDRDLKRITEQRLSPLYISVHTTNGDLRQKMMGTARAGEILQQLQYLSEHGIEMHTQMVLCPGFNDGKELSKTLADLAKLWPQVRSVALVPVGLTMFRERLFALSGYTPGLARDVICTVEREQKRFSKEFGYPFVFAADEFYLCGGIAIPEYKRYVDFPQVENGVGITRIFLEEWAKTTPDMPCSLKSPRKVTVITSKLARSVLVKIVAALGNISGLSLKLVAVENNFFGKSVTVAGLLTGKDILSALHGRDLGDCLILPAVLLKEEESVFLDGMTLLELERLLNTPVAVAETPKDLLRLALG